MKKQFNNYDFGTPEYVYHHGLWRKSRGKKPSAQLIAPGYICIKNPQRAFEAVRGIFEKRRTRRFRFNSLGQTRLEAALGIANPHQPPWPGARKVPFTCYQWY